MAFGPPLPPRRRAGQSGLDTCLVNMSRLVPMPVLVPMTLFGPVVMMMRMPRVMRQFPILAAVAGHDTDPRAAVSYPLLDQVEDLRLEAEIVGAGHAQMGILAAKVIHLAADALNQGAGEEVVGQDDDLGHAQSGLALDDPLQAREGDAGESDVHQVVVAGLVEPARHLGHLTVGHGVRGSPAEEDDAGGPGVRAIQGAHGLMQAPF